MKSLLLLIFFTALSSHAAIFSPQGVEVKFSYTTSFQTSEIDSDPIELAGRHMQHLFGFLHSPALVEGYKINSETPGIGAPRLPVILQITQDQKKSGARKITYKTSGTLLLHKKVAAEILPVGAWEITMPANLDKFYDENCTDEHYNSIDDFWYFYDPFLEDCEYLAEAPLANKVVVKVAAMKNIAADASAAFDEIRADNGNGELLQITTINGFSEDSKNPADDGRLSFEEVNIWLRKSGFTETVVASYANRPVLQFEKNLKKKDGSVVAVRITRLLAETAIAKKNVTFAKFFKAAIKDADVIIYAGHSGLGGNLDIPSLEDKVGTLEFIPGKRQLIFLDGCSTYSYYLSMFADRAPKNQLSILTNGLVSYFTYEPFTHIALMKRLFKVNENPTWSEVLADMEKTLGGMSYLLSVGSL